MSLRQVCKNLSGTNKLQSYGQSSSSVALFKTDSFADTFSVLGI